MHLWISRWDMNLGAIGDFQICKAKESTSRNPPCHQQLLTMIRSAELLILQRQKLSQDVRPVNGTKLKSRFIQVAADPLSLAYALMHGPFPAPGQSAKVNFPSSSPSDHKLSFVSFQAPLSSARKIDSQVPPVMKSFSLLVILEASPICSQWFLYMLFQ